MTRGVLEYFRSSQQRNPRWKLPEELHVLLLRQIASEKHCIDLAYILKELGLADPLCDACQKMLARDAFDQGVLGNAQRHKRKAVCLACAALGYTPRDVAPNPCVECGDKGHLKFTRQKLADYKRRGRRTQLVCTECCTRPQAIEAKLKDRKGFFMVSHPSSGPATAAAIRAAEQVVL